MKLHGKIKNATVDIFKHKVNLTFEVDQEDTETAEFQDLQQLEDLNITISKQTKRRSLEANAYCWLLIGKIAEKLRTTKIGVYREYIKDCGIYRVVTVDAKAVDTFKHVWQSQGLGWLCETSESRTNGFVDVVAYYGTSSYNAKQMARFIDYVVEEAKSLGIETLTAREIEAMKNEQVNHK